MSFFISIRGGEIMNNKNFVIKNQTETTADIYIYGDIVSDAFWDNDVDPTGVQKLLDSLKGKNLTLYINSNGGDVFSGTAIYNMLKRHDGRIKAHVDGLAASIASLILMAADEIEIPSNAYVMVHRPKCGTYGDSDDLMRYADLLEGIENNLIEAYKTHSNLSDEALKDYIHKETWFNGQDFKANFEKGVKLLESISAVACVSELSHKHLPRDLVLSNKNSEELERQKQEVEIALAML